MSDLVQRLCDAHSMALQADFAPDMAGLYREAADEIERLQKFAGAITTGHSVAEIKEMLRTPEGVAKLKANYASLTNG